MKYNRATHVLLLLILTTLSLQANAAVGRTSGAGSVSPIGAANYAIPIQLPPGTNNLAPVLSLVYDHRNGDSLLGVGFAISGLSAITRCSKTIAQDGVMSDPLLVADDSYCLDGNRLQRTSGTQGVAGSTYQTEIETFARATAVGTVGGGPASWEVRKSDGLIYQYGATTDSFIETVGSTTARVWALNKVSDRAGNYITFTYTEDTTNGAYRPNQIFYTAHPSGVAAATKVSFVYESANRPDPLYAYRYGNSTADGKIHEFKRLDRIDIADNATSAVIRTVDLSYESAGGAGNRSRLASVQECAGGDCLAATTFQWIDGTPGWDTEANTAVAVTPGGLIMDINGDGRDDVVYASSATSGSGTWYYMLGSDSGFTAPVNTGITNWSATLARGIEWNGDTLGDILYPCNGSTNWCVLQATGTGFASAIDTGAAVNGDQSLTTVADINGDGRHDLVRILTGSLPHRLGLRLRNGAGFDPEVTAWTAGSNDIRLAFDMPRGGIVAGDSHIRRRDYNGDGREDFNLRIRENSGEPGVPDLTYQFTFYGKGNVINTPGSYTTANTPGVPGDFNGDGLTDLVYLSSGTCAVRFGRGIGLSAPVAGPSCAIGLPYVIDYDGDGLSDLLLNNGSNWMVARSTGNGFTAFASTGITTTGTVLAMIADVNNDGLHDLVRADFTSSNQFKYRLHSGVLPDLLDRATDGFGVFIDFNYQRLTVSSGGCYTRDSGIATPSGTPFTGSMYVVCGTSASNGIGGTYTTSHSYYNAQYDYSGRGFLGFARKGTTDSRYVTRLIEDFRQDFPFIGMTKESRVLQADGTTTITRTTNTYASEPYTGVLRYYPYVQSQTKYDYEVGGTYNAALLRTAVTTNTIDPTSGAITLSTTVVTEGSSANGLNANAGRTFTYSTSIPSGFLFNDTANWCLGRAEKIIQANSHQLNGGTELQRTSTATWDGPKCRPTQTVSEPDSAEFKVTTVPGYDDFGNVNSISVQPIAGQGQGNRTTLIDWGTTGRFPETITNAKSQTTTLTWDAALGLRKNIRDPNLLSTALDYDSFGRLQRVTRPDATATDYVLVWCNSEPCQLGDVSMRVGIRQVERTSANAEISRRYALLDMFDRTTWVQAQVQSGAFSTVRTFYDARGWVSQVTMPYFDTDPVRATTTTHDIIGRPTLIERPKDEADTGNTHQTQISYQGLRTVLTNARGYSSQEIRNAIGEIVQTIDQGSADTDYEYDAFGNLLKVIDYNGNTTTLTYNNLGMKFTSNDPDMGARQYTYYPLGELKTQTDAKGNVTTFTYDELSRVLTRVEPLDTSTTPLGTTIFGYDVGNKAIGQLTSASSPLGYSEGYVFDNYGRPSQTNITADSTTYTYDYSYDTAGQLDTMTYPTSSPSYRFKLKYGYSFGQMTSINDYTGNVLGTTYWQRQGMNARGQTMLEAYGSGLSTSSGYDRVTGLLEYRTTGPSGGTTIQNLSYDWDPMGNLELRQDSRMGYTETYTYDSLDRLWTVKRNSSLQLTMSYDAIGNILSKSDVGTYAYDTTKKHAVVSTSGTVNNSYAYDANGNMRLRNGQTTTWYSSNLPHTINSSTTASRFWYGPTGQRWKQQRTTGSSVGTTTYIGPHLERLVTSSINEFRHTIYGPSGPIAVYKRSSNGSSSSTRYLTTDSLGSFDVATTTAGVQDVNISFNVWGERKGADGISAPTAQDITDYKNITNRGFTFHEHLEEHALIHMNGRVYDPSIGRFMSADPFVQAPYSSQSLNRYSYVFNNPLSFTDPSGFQTAADGGGTSNTASIGLGFPLSYRFFMRESDRGGELRLLGGVRFNNSGCVGMGCRNIDVCALFGRCGPRPGATDNDQGIPMPERNVVPTMAADQVTTVNSYLGTWGDFAFGAARGAIDDTAQLVALTGSAHFLIQGDYQKAFVGLRLAMAGPMLGAPSTARGEFGYEVGPLIVAAIGGVAGGAKEVATKAGTQGTAKVWELIATHGKTMSNKQLDKLVKSIRLEGIKDPLTVTELEGRLYILDGHHRALAAPRAGVTEVPINRVELPFGAYKTVDDLIFTP